MSKSHTIYFLKIKLNSDTDNFHFHFSSDADVLDTNRHFHEYEYRIFRIIHYQFPPLLLDHENFHVLSDQVVYENSGTIECKVAAPVS